MYHKLKYKLYIYINDNTYSIMNSLGYISMGFLSMNTPIDGIIYLD